LDGECAMEQSDLVILVLNLANIPDPVVKEMDFEPGFSKRFTTLMEKFKEGFEKEHGVEWGFQDEKLEAKYNDFMDRKQVQLGEDIDTLAKKFEKKGN